MPPPFNFGRRQDSSSPVTHPSVSDNTAHEAVPNASIPASDAGARYNYRAQAHQSRRHPAWRTLDIRRLGCYEQLRTNEEAPDLSRSSGIVTLYRNMFSCTGQKPSLPPSADLISQPSTATVHPPSFPESPAALLHWPHAASSTLFRGGRRQAAANSLGSLQSYATTTIRSRNGSLLGCIGMGSTSDVVMKKRVTVSNDRDGEPVFSKALRDTTLLSYRPQALEYPNIALRDFGGRGDWSSDVFVLPHNAIRWEIMGLYTVLSSMQRRWSGLIMLDVRELSEYWEVFEVFVAQYFEIEDQIIFPFMLDIASDSSDLKKYHKQAIVVRHKAEKILQEAGSILEMFNSVPACDVLLKIYSHMTMYLPVLLEYMQQQENVLPAVFATHCNPEHRALINRASANFIVRAVNGRDGIAILTRPIEDSMIMQMWRSENLSSSAHSSHRRWVSNLELNHVDIPQRFQRRMRRIP